MKNATQNFLALFLILTLGFARLFGQNIFTKITDPANPIVTFTPTGGYAGTTWVDYDNDEDLDLFVNEEFLFRNDGSGNFTQLAASQHGIESGHIMGDLHDGNTWGDFNNDGWIDVYLANRSSALFKNNGDGTFSKVDGVQSTNVNAWAAAFGDYDADGWLDLVAVHPAGFIGASHENYLFKSNGASAFTAVQNDVTMGLDAYTVGSWSDFDLDGDLDLFIGSGEVSQLSPDHIYFNQLAQTGTADLVKSECPLVCTDPRDGQNWNWIDYDNDGDLDGFVTNYTKANDFYRNDGGAFHKLTINDLGGADLVTLFLSNWLVNVWEDYDNDGDLDVFLGTDGPGSADYLYLNDGDGTFTKTEQAFLAGATRGVTAGDYDNDGDVDLFILGAGAPGKGLFQNAGNQNNWISLNLKGSTVNRSAIGAKVRAKATIGGVPTWQIREVSSQNSFCGSNSLRVHFGLGDAAMMDTLIIEWSADVAETFTRLDTNQFCSIEEGVGTTCLNISPASAPEETLAFLKANPNPGKQGEIQIHYRFPKPDDVQVEIFRLDGAKVWQGTFPNSAENQFMVRSENLQAGFYTLKVHAGAEVLTKSLVFTK